MILPAQCRAARALLNWSVAKLSRQAGVPISYIFEFERGRLVPQLDTSAKLMTAVANAGVDLLAEADGSIGVLLRSSGKISGDVFGKASR